MSGIWGWFGGANAAQQKKNSPKNAILGLRAQLEMLQKREKHLMNQMEEQDGIARKNVNSNKAAAKAALRRKKLHEHNLDQTISQMGNLEQQINNIESANIQVETLAAMERAGKAMHDIHGKLTPEKVDDIMDELRKQNDISQEIQTAISTSGIGTEIDDEDLDEELAELQQEQLDKEMLTSGPTPMHNVEMPAAGNKPIPIKQQAVEEDDEEEELKRLQAEMAM